MKTTETKTSNLVIPTYLNLPGSLMNFACGRESEEAAWPTRASARTISASWKSGEFDSLKRMTSPGGVARVCVRLENGYSVPPLFHTTAEPMSEEQQKAFLEKVKGDTGLQEKLKAAANSEAVVSIAKEAGYMISADDLTKAQSLTEEELEGVAGGACLNNPIVSQLYPNTIGGACIPSMQC